VTNFSQHDAILTVINGASGEVFQPVAIHRDKEGYSSNKC